jgi:hypothetical protein
MDQTEKALSLSFQLPTPVVEVVTKEIQNESAEDF